MHSDIQACWQHRGPWSYCRLDRIQLKARKTHFNPENQRLYISQEQKKSSPCPALQILAQNNPTRPSSASRIQHPETSHNQNRTPFPLSSLPHPFGDQVLGSSLNSSGPCSLKPLATARVSGPISSQGELTVSSLRCPSQGSETMSSRDRTGPLPFPETHLRVSQVRSLGASGPLRHNSGGPPSVSFGYLQMCSSYISKNTFQFENRNSPELNFENQTAA